tara:strand:+ start:207 stop:440 length:234 start_codon:yes stop_codon:yes gene_type:complete
MKMKIKKNNKNVHKVNKINKVKPLTKKQEIERIKNELKNIDCDESLEDPPTISLKEKYFRGRLGVILDKCDREVILF